MTESLKKSESPKVTVLMAVYNGEKYLKESIGSILSQTFENFEFLIIDDGSTDNSTEIVKSYSDPRIKLVFNESNQGLVYSLNKGIRLSQGEYIARMDHDDISMPYRLEKEVNFLDQNRQIGACGSWIEIFGDEIPHILKYSTAPDVIKCKLFFFNTIAHPSVMVRRELLLQNNLFYDPEYIRAEDFDFWQRCSLQFDIVNIPEVLVKYRVIKSQRESNLKQVTETLIKIDIKSLKLLGINPNEEEIQLHQAISPLRQPPIPYDMDFVIRTESWLRKILEANIASKLYPEKTFSELLGERWFAVCNRNAEKYSFRVWMVFWRSPLSRMARLSFNSKIKFLLKCFKLGS